MALHYICRYQEQGSYGAYSNESGAVIGHHIIPDHCFYYTSGLRGMGDLTAFLCPGVEHYRTMDAPVIMVTADSNGENPASMV